MKNQLPSYKSIFLNLLKDNKREGLSEYHDPELWVILEKEERELLAQLFLVEAEELISHDFQEIEKIKFSLQACETLDPRAELAMHIAAAYFRYGLIYRSIDFLQLALAKVEEIAIHSTDFLKNSYDLKHLWGNIFVTMGQYSPDLTFCEKAMEKYQESLEHLEKVLLQTDDPFKISHLQSQKAAIYWHWALGWVLLGRNSGEESDYSHACHLYQKAMSYFKSIPAAFYMDFSTALVSLGTITGKSSFLLDAMEYLKLAISDSYPMREGKVKEKAQESIYQESWVRFADCNRILYELTGHPFYFNQADESYEQAIIVCPKKEQLWLDWAKLYLNRGWFNREVVDFESAVEKLTSIHTEKYNIIHVSALFGQSLIGIGMIWDDLKFLREGLKRIIEMLDIVPEHPHLLKVAGLSSLSFGNYFNDERYFIKAMGLFEKGLAFDTDTYGIEFLHGLFLSYLAFSELKKEPVWLEKAVEIIERICELRPECPYYWNEWGVSLIKFREYEKYRENLAQYVEIALQKFEKAILLREELSAESEIEWLYNYACTLDTLGEMNFDEGLIEKAIEIFKEILEVDPHHRQARYELAVALTHLGEEIADVVSFEEAIELFESFLEQDQEDELLHYDLGYALINLSELIEDRHQSEKAKNLKRRAEYHLLRSSSLGNPQAYYILACLYALNDNHIKAIEFLEHSEKSGVLPDLDDLMQDDWLENLVNTDQFREFVALRRG